MASSPFSRRTFIAGSAAAATAAAAAQTVVGASSASAAIPGPSSYSASWASVDQHPPAAEWFQDAKFGIYFHWGAFSVPAFGSEWYGHNMYIEGNSVNTHHKNVFGDPAAWPYRNFIDGGRDKSGNYYQFAPKLTSAGGSFDPNDWAQLFVDAGAKFAGPVAEHHDGFSMWNSSVNEWNSVAKGPRLNLLQLHANAIRAKGLKLVVAMHHAYNFTGFYDHAPTAATASLRKLYGQLSNAEEQTLWYDKLKEVIDLVQPDILWQDFNLPRVTEAQRLKFLAYYYNRAVAWNKEVVATYKDGFDNKGEVYDYERGGPAGLTTPYWLTDDSISSSSWSYRTGLGYYSTPQMLHSLIDRVSKNGNMLLNISPMANGVIPQAQRTILLGIGDYLKRFGESIYSTRAWSTFGEGPTRMGGGSFTTPRAGTASDIRFTRSKDSRVLYATILGWPGGSINIATLSSSRINLSTLTSVQLLGPNAGSYINLPNRSQDSGGLRVTLPSRPFDALAYVVKFTFSGTIPGSGGSTGGGGGTSAAGITAYADVNYTGAASTFALGTYTSSQLGGVGAANISSLRVPAGYRATGYSGNNSSGTSWTFTGDNGDLRNTNNNDAINSLRVTFNPATYFRLTNVTNGLSLDSGGNVAAGTALKQFAWDGSTNLQWQAVDLGTGYYRLVNRTNGLVADTYGNTTDGANVAQAAWNNGNNQQWAISHQGSGRFRLTNRGTGKVLDNNGATASGSTVVTWTSNSSTNTLWTFTAV